MHLLDPLLRRIQAAPCNWLLHAALPHESPASTTSPAPRAGEPRCVGPCLWQFTSCAAAVKGPGHASWHWGASWLVWDGQRCGATRCTPHEPLARVGPGKGIGHSAAQRLHRASETFVERGGPQSTAVQTSHRFPTWRGRWGLLRQQKAPGKRREPKGSSGVQALVSEPCVEQGRPQSEAVQSSHRHPTREKGRVALPAESPWQAHGATGAQRASRRCRTCVKRGRCSQLEAMQSSHRLFTWSGVSSGNSSRFWCMVTWKMTCAAHHVR